MNTTPLRTACLGMAAWLAGAAFAQAVLLDRQSLIVGYDEARGEPREKIRNVGLHIEVECYVQGRRGKVGIDQRPEPRFRIRTGGVERRRGADVGKPLGARPGVDEHEVAHTDIAVRRGEF